MDKKEIEKFGMSYGELSKLVALVEPMVKELSVGCDIHNEANHLVCFIRDYCDERMMEKIKTEWECLKASREKLEKEIKSKLIAQLK